MIEKLYLINLCLIITHEIDSAYWKEWEMFYLPGGIQFFNIINFLLIVVLIWGYRSVVLKTRSGFNYSIAMSSIGIIAFIIHGIFMLNGYEQFTLPVSMLILVVCFITSISQLIRTFMTKKIFTNV